MLLLPITFLLVTRKNPFPFFAGMTEALIFLNLNFPKLYFQALLVNFGTASSIASFPVTLKCLTSKNGIDQHIASLILSITVLIQLANYPIIGFLYIARQEGTQLGVEQIVMAVLVLAILAYGTGGVPQATLLTVLLLCPMFGVPTTRVASILAADLLIDRIHKTIADASVIAVVAHLSSNRATLSSASTTATATATAVQQVMQLSTALARHTGQ